MRKALLGVALALWLAPAGQAATRLLYTSDWNGPTEIFSVDPAGKAPRGQVTFVRAIACDGLACGVFDPIPSPNGRFVVYRGSVRADPLSSEALFLARADGGNATRLAPRDAETSLSFGTVAWSPDSRRIAYVACSREATRCTSCAPTDPATGS